MRSLLFCAFVGLVAGFGAPPEIEDQCNQNLANATFVAVPSDCASYWHCVHGWPILRTCPPGTIWSLLSKDEGYCDQPHLAINDACGHVRPIPTDEELGIFDDAESGCQFVCNNGIQCIKWEAVCDNELNCDDGSDEGPHCAATCDPLQCRLPDCRCSGFDVPGGLLPNETPQFVILSMESVRVEDMQHIILNIFNQVDRNRRRTPRVNPNGCPITGTFFVEHQFADYGAVQYLYANLGNEIATMGISKSVENNYWRDASEQLWFNEMAGHRSTLARLANVNPADVKGIKAPFLQGGGDRQLNMMEAAGFEYDMSLPTQQLNPPMWPYTFDYRTTQECVIPPCPVSPHPGKWEVPLVDLVDTNDTVCSEVDNCFFPRSKAESLQLLFDNFRRHYETNRAPYALAFAPGWFHKAAYNLEAVQEFLDEIGEMNDVYVVSVDTVLKWIENPTRVADVGSSAALDCGNLGDREQICSKFNLCAYYNITHPPNSIEHQGERYFQTCASCPPRYPWLGYPEGNL